MQYGSALAAAARLQLPCHKAARQFVIYAAVAARNARAPRGQKNAPRIFALLFFTKFFCDDDFLKKIYESFLRIYFRKFFMKIFPKFFLKFFQSLLPNFFRGYFFTALILRKLHKKKSVGTLNFLPK